MKINQIHQEYKGKGQALADIAHVEGMTPYLVGQIMENADSLSRIQEQRERIIQALNPASD